MECGIVMMSSVSFWPGNFLRIASRSFNGTLQYDAEFTFSPHFRKTANSTPWGSQIMVSITFPADGVTLNFLVEDELGCSQSSCEPLYATNTSHRKEQTFLYKCALHWVLLPTKTHNRTLLFDSILHKHGRHFDYWNQHLNMSMRLCYLDCQGAGMCFYLVVHKPITSITVVLLPFVSYLLTLPGRTLTLNIGNKLPDYTTKDDNNAHHVLYLLDGWYSALSRCIRELYR
jgi:hypothetical protein